MVKSCNLRRAYSIKPGEKVCFESEGANYVVESVEDTPIGMIRHSFRDDTGSASYWPGEWLYVSKDTAEPARS